MWKRKNAKQDGSNERGVTTSRLDDPASKNASEEVETTPMSQKERDYAAYLLRKAGIDFEQFRHAGLADQVGGLISPFDHLVAFLLGAVPGFLLSIVIWYVFFFETSTDVRVVMFVFACGIGVAFGTLLGVIVDVLRSFQAVSEIVDLGVVAARSVRNESKNIGVSAFRRLSKDEIATGVTWIVFMPVAAATLRKRLKVKWVSGPTIGFLQVLLRRIFPLQVPADAEARIAALPPIASRDAQPNVQASSSLMKQADTTKALPAATEDDTQDWIQFLERSRPKVLRAARKTRNMLMLPLVGIALLILVIMVGGAALVAHVII